MTTDDPEFRQNMDLILAELADAIRNIRNVERLTTNDRTRECAFFARTNAERVIQKLQQFGTLAPP
jgi:hypothetical protein